jgi:tRNA1Val (adenine37-N6)-methyltransferase
VANSFFQFKQFLVHQDRCAMKVTTDACLFGAWVARAVALGNSAIDSAIDIGAGTGLLSLMLLQKSPKVKLDAIEIDELAARQAKENFEASPWANSLRIICADIRSYDFKNRYDLIVSNPPFFENDLKSPDEKRNLAHHSQELSLNTLVSMIKNTLTPSGSYYLLLPAKRREEALLMFKNKGFSTNTVINIRQSPEHDNFRVILGGNLSEQSKLTTHDLSIWNESKQYTPEFVDLLKDYYLYL